MSQSVFCVGFSGHQQLDDESTINFVACHLRKLLIDYREQAHQSGRELLVYSALALGADQLFVNIALELGISVEAVIPCASYEEIFTSSELISEYHRLLNGCQQVHRLPSQDCSDDAFLAAGQWIVDNSDIVILAWNGYSAGGRGGTADVATYARFSGCPFVHVHTRFHTVKQYGDLASGLRNAHAAASRKFAVEKQTVYQGSVLAVNQYRLRMPDGKEIVRDIVERPESVLVLPVGQKQTVLLIEEYDLGAESWQLTLPGGKVDDVSSEGIMRRAEIELREETGYRAGRMEKLLDFYNHPGYISHKVHLFAAYDLEWDPLEIEAEELIRVQTFTWEEALEATRLDYRFDPEAALALWLYIANRLGVAKEL